MTNAQQLPVIRFWFEFASTYSYPAVARIEAEAAAARVVVEWQPFLLGPIFGAQGWSNSPFNLYPAKGRYMWRDLERICSGMNLPFRRPSIFPQNGLLAARVATVANLDAGAHWCPAFTRAVFAANFVEGRDISRSETIAECLAVAGQPAGEVLERAAQPEVKARLRQATEEAMALGIFGAPSFTIGDEVFWGNDRLEQALSWAKGGGKTPVVSPVVY